jgi:hypothetical protein
MGSNGDYFKDIAHAKRREYLTRTPNAAHLYRSDGLPKTVIRYGLEVHEQIDYEVVMNHLQNKRVTEGLEQLTMFFKAIPQGQEAFVNYCVQCICNKRGDEDLLSGIVLVLAYGQRW